MSQTHLFKLDAIHVQVVVLTDMKSIVVIAHDMRSTYNVGSLLRTAEGLGVKKLYLTGYTPHPKYLNDDRLPHIANKIDGAISKTSLGAENMVDWEHVPDIIGLINSLKNDGYTVCALEQTPNAIDLTSFSSPEKCVIVLGTEVTGLPENILKLCDKSLLIPMFGKKESFNVVQAAAMALYQLRFH